MADFSFPLLRRADEPVFHLPFNMKRINVASLFDFVFLTTKNSIS
jgi:hypothetical protein